MSVKNFKHDNVCRRSLSHTRETSARYSVAADAVVTHTHTHTRPKRRPRFLNAYDRFFSPKSYATTWRRTTTKMNKIYRTRHHRHWVQIGVCGFANDYCDAAESSRQSPRRAHCVHDIRTHVVHRLSLMSLRPYNSCLNLLNTCQDYKGLHNHRMCKVSTKFFLVLIESFHHWSTPQRKNILLPQYWIL